MSSQPLIPPPPLPEIGLRPTLPDPSTAEGSGYLPSLPHAESVAFRHPAYDDQNNTFLRLRAFDTPDSVNWGIHHDTALIACSIIACNMKGFLTPTRLGSLPYPTVPSPESMLMGRVYYFYPSAYGNSDTAGIDLRYPVCPDFLHWQFPHNEFPPNWTNIDEQFHTSVAAIPAVSQYSLAVQKRDGCCRISGYRDGSQTAHIVPEAQSEWFGWNGMSIYNLNEDIPPKFITCDVENCLLLRQDLHTAFDSKHFVIVPKQRSWRIHFLAHTADYGRLLHNRKPHALMVSPQFLFARFAWAIIGRVKMFASLPGVKIRVRASNGQWEEIVNQLPTIPLAIAPVAKRRRKNEVVTTRTEPANDDCDAAHPTPAIDTVFTSSGLSHVTPPSKQTIFDAVVAQSPDYAWNAMRWHPDSDRLKVMRDRYLMEHEPILHAREVCRQLTVLEGGGILWDDGSEADVSGDDSDMDWV